MKLILTVKETVTRSIVLDTEELIGADCAEDVFEVAKLIKDIHDEPLGYVDGFGDNKKTERETISVELDKLDTTVPWY